MIAWPKLFPAFAVVAALTAACDPFGLPATRALENGAQSMLSSATSYELARSSQRESVARAALLTPGVALELEL